MSETAWEDALDISAFSAEASGALTKLLWAMGECSLTGSDVADQRAVWEGFKTWELLLLECSRHTIERVRDYLLMKCGPADQ
ncbi:hypothetical protein GCM10007874_10660 [Labrys miyagiensis]|uniref:Uncharacterized protein n=1 Tax=Labrys miyagiensis TaxID=346912 RepID=A0ABQ6CD36_9HYPH|nr:hypothetical protein [Labrys miyagiensis]GLS18050.1 hypothetical protein GCM10007874_10660 [Labrys miyagiensis]